MSTEFLIKAYPQMLTGNELVTTVGTLPTQAARGIAFRSIRAEFANTPLSTQGSLLVGGRYNPPQSLPEAFGCLYLADSLDTAHKEVRVVVETASGLIKVQGLLRTEFSIEYRLNALLDLTLSNIQNALGTNLQELTGLWRPFNAEGNLAPTQALGVAANNSQDIEALKVFSVWGGYNLVLFPDKLSAGSFLRAYDDSGMLMAQLP